MFVKRPVYNRQLKCVAFEILSYKDIQLTEEMTKTLLELITNSDTQLPLFIPFTLKTLIEHFEPPVQNPIILKLEAQEIESIYSLKELQECVFSIALMIDTPQQLAWLNFAEYVGLTEHLMNGSNVLKVVKYSKSKQRKVIAYGLHLPLSFEKCKAMTMDYYCGDFLFKPSHEEPTQIAANKLNLLQLIETLQNKDCDFKTVSTIIQTDPLLSFQLLKVMNSAGFSNGISIGSIEQAIARMGLINLKNWVILFSMKNISDKPIEILESGLIRARMAESLASKSPNISSQSAYTAGLLSILDCLLNKSMPELMNQITLAKEIKEALLNQSGPLGELLALVVSYEQGNWEKITNQEFNGINLSQLYIETLDFVAKNVKAFRA
jgi:EAL and modified HD-GYP domain-containing signal transduction protein